MIEAFVDKRGERVKIGDALVVGSLAGGAADIRIGRVVAFTDQTDAYSSDRQPLIEMEWEVTKSGRNSYAPKTSMIFADNGRFLIIEKAEEKVDVDHGN